MMHSLFTLPFSIAALRWHKFFSSAVRPRFINFIITYRCNLRCRMCGIWHTYIADPGKAAKELTLKEIKDFLEKNRKFLNGVRHIGLTGGEPFLREDIVEIIRLIRAFLPQARTGIQTNGMLEGIEKKLEEIIGFYPEFGLAVSIDGTRATHDKVRGVEGAFDRALAIIKYARRLGIPVTTGMTLSRLNYREIAEVKEIADRLGTEFSCFPAEEAEYFNNESAEFSLDREMKQEVVKRLEPFGYHYYMHNLKLLMEGRRKKSFRCYSGYASLVIDPYGFVKPCILKEKSFGNIRDTTLGGMLNGPEAKALRKSLKGCFCWCQCEVSSSIATDPLDAASWFLFACPQKGRFIREAKAKMNKIAP